MRSLNLLRRRFLTGGTAAFLGAYFARIQARAADPVPRRLVLINCGNGTVPDQFWPVRRSDTDFTLNTIMKPLEPFRRQLLVLDGLEMASALAEQLRGDAHYPNVVNVLTGTKVSEGIGPSLDQHLATDVPQPTALKVLNLGAQSGGFPTPCYPAPVAGVSQRGVRDLQDPAMAFAKVMGTGTTSPAKPAGPDLRRSLLDFATQDIQALRPRLPAQERALLDAHLTAVREAESSLARAVAPAAVSPAEACKAGATPPTIDLKDPANLPAVTRAMIDVIALAIACDRTRVVSMNLGSPKDLHHFTWLGINAEYHAISHWGRPEYKGWHTQIDTWNCEQVALLAQKLASMSNGAGGTLLDDTVLLWSNNCATGLHGKTRVPFVIVGGSRAGVKGGRALTFDRRPHNDLLTALAQLMGSKVTRFGTGAFNTGPLGLG